MTVNQSRVLKREREVMDKFLPGLDEALAAVPFAELERRGGPAFALFKEHGGIGLLAPADRGGLGAEPTEAVMIQRAIASRAPSLAVATMMHHLSVSTFAEYLTQNFAADADEWAILEMITAGQMLVASASAEGRSGQSVLLPKMTAEMTEGGYVLNGSKKPCSMTYSMNLLTASVLVSGGGNSPEVGFAIVPADSSGIERSEFWGIDVLAGAESDQVTLKDVFVPSDFVLTSGQRPGMSMDALQIRGWTWFELLACASYLGMAATLLETAMAGRGGASSEVGRLLAQTESATWLVENAASQCQTLPWPDALAQSLLVRSHVQDLISDVATSAAELIGGIGFIADEKVAYLHSACRMMAFHPPNMRDARVALAAYMSGERFDTTVF